MNFIDHDKLNKVLDKEKDFFKKAEPFPHLVIDNFLNEKDAKIISDVFPSDNSINWNIHGSGPNADRKNFRGIKLQCSDENEFPDEIKRLMNEFNSQGFLYFLQKLTDVEYIFGDPYYNGCGLHSTGRGGRLMIHADVNRYPYPSLADQYLNCILYVSENWQGHWGGELELWDKRVKKCVRKIEPKFNRLVIFKTDRDSFHGHPIPIECPDEARRNSLATYFYIPTISKDQLRNDQTQTVLWQRTNKHDKKFSTKYLKHLIYIFLLEFSPPFFLRKFKEIIKKIKNKK